MHDDAIKAINERFDSKEKIAFVEGILLGLTIAKNIMVKAENIVVAQHQIDNLRSELEDA